MLIWALNGSNCLLSIQLQKCFPGYWMSIESYFPSYRERTDLIQIRSRVEQVSCFAHLTPHQVNIAHTGSLTSIPMRYLHWNVLCSVPESTSRSVWKMWWICRVKNVLCFCTHQKCVLFRRSKSTTSETAERYFSAVPKIWERQWGIQGTMWEDTLLTMWA